MMRELVGRAPGISEARPGEAAIGDVAREFNISLRALRFYEDKGLLHPRRQGTARFYNERDRIRLALILKGKRLGFTLAEVRDLITARANVDPDSRDGDLTVGLDRQQIANQIAHLEKQREELDDAIAELRRAYHRMADALA